MALWRSGAESKLGAWSLVNDPCAVVMLAKVKDSCPGMTTQINGLTGTMTTVILGK